MRENESPLWSSGFLANRPELIARTGSPQGEPDNALLRHLFDRYGLETPRLLAGPFAWVLWNPDRRRLVAARDRLGIRTLYYAFQGRTVHLAGEVGELLAALPTRPVPNLQAVAAHIHGRVPAQGETFFDNVRELLPGEMLAAGDDRIETSLYWQPNPGRTLRLANDEAYAAALRERLFAILPGYAPAGPAGVTLSGGMDSGTVTAILSHGARETALTAFTWTSAELPQADESRNALAVCQALGCPAVPIAADQHWPLRREPGLRPSLETPLFNFYTDLWEATFEASRARGISVLFSGLGGDALFGGDVFSYPDLLLTGHWLRLARELHQHLPHSRLRLPGIVRRMVLGPIARSVFKLREQRPTSPVPWIGRKLRGVFREAVVNLPRNVLPGRRERLKILGDPFLPAVASLTTAHAGRCGIDFRHPFLDHRLIEFALSLPTSQTFSAGWRKKILRNALRGLLPSEVVEQRHKVYPIAILHRGLREREQDKVWSMMRDMRAADMGFVEPGPLRNEYQRYIDGRTESHLFWHTLTLEAWLRRYF